MSGIFNGGQDRYNERADVARRILELSGTVMEAVDYLVNKLGSGWENMDTYIGVLKDIGEGLISLDNAVSAISEPSEADPVTMRQLEENFDELSEYMNTMIDACMEAEASGEISRSAISISLDAPVAPGLQLSPGFLPATDLHALAGMFKESYVAYYGGLSRCFRHMSIM